MFNNSMKLVLYYDSEVNEQNHERFTYPHFHSCYPCISHSLDLGLPGPRKVHFRVQEIGTDINKPSVQ